MAAKTYGQVWLGIGVGEEAACAMVFVYNAAGCDPEDYIKQTPTDSCGYYTLTGLSDNRSYWITIEFPVLECTMGSYYGTCPYTKIDCEEVPIPDMSQGVVKNWFLGLSQCFNIGCPP